jgi:hypothetical protein
MFNKQGLRTGWMGCLFAVLVLSMALGGRLLAQTDTAQIEGSVSDSSGAQIQGATVTLTDTDTGSTHIVTSDRQGALGLLLWSEAITRRRSRPRASRARCRCSPWMYRRFRHWTFI